MDQEEHINQIRENLHSSRASSWRWGLFWAILGLITIADSGSPFPIPLVGLPSILAGLAATGYGALLLYKQQELPLSEALEIAALHQGFVSGPLLVRTLHITPETADRILEELSKRNYLKLEEQSLEQGEISYKAIGLLPPPPGASK